MFNSINGSNDLISSSSSSYPNNHNLPFSFESSNKLQETIHSSSLILPPPLSFFQFPHSPPPFKHNNNDDDIDFLFFGQQQQQNHHDLCDALAEVMEIPKKKVPPARVPAAEQIPRKRSAKRDRHSKIKTAKGLRDRRMRLSLDVAKRFFGLQDMLGFDKASKTVEWLLNQAKVEIKRLAREKNSSSKSSTASSTSECDVSGLDEVVASGERDQIQKRNNNRIRSSGKVCRKSAFNSVGREKARERARERTREKMMRTRGIARDDDDGDGTKQCNRILLCSWNPFETAPVEEDSGKTITHAKSVNVPAEQLVPISTNSQALLEDENSNLVNIMNKWLNNHSGILLHHENEYVEFHEGLGKTWEAYNNQI